MPDLIYQEIDKGEKVIVFALQPEDREYNGIKVDMVIGLEDNLIKEFKPEWNKRLENLRREQKLSKQK